MAKPIFLFHTRPIFLSPVLGLTGAWVLAVMVVMAMAGCGVSGELPRMESGRGITAVGEPIDATVPRGATLEKLSGDAKRLAVDVGRAMDRSHWGRLHVTHYDEAGDSKGGQSKVIVRAEALLADERTAEIVAWSETSGAGGVSAAIRVGLVGDPAVERAFLKTLQDVLDGPAVPVRDKDFHLPANWPGVGGEGS